MKILNIHDYPPTEGGGIEINVSEVSKKLVEMGHRVTIATSRTSSETYQGEDKSETGPKEVHAVLLGSLKQLHRLIDESDVVHIHFTFSCREAAMLGMEYCRSINKHCLVSIRTNISHIPFSNLSTLSALEADAKLTRARELLMSKNVLLLAPSESVGLSLCRFGVGKKVVVVRNGISDAFVDNSVFGNYSKVDLTYVGELSSLKGIGFLIEAFGAVSQNLPDLKLRLIGGGSEVSGLKMVIADKELGSRVDFVGYVNHDQISSYLKSTKVYVHPTLSEAWSNSVMEALALGVPVIASGVEGVKELTSNGEFANLVPPGQVGALIGAIKDVFSNSLSYDLLKEKADNGSDYIKSHYTVANQARELIALYGGKL